MQKNFTVTDENAPLVAEICVRLDGLPLALELAAAWLKLLSPQGLLARLDSRLQLLTGGAVDLPARQQTIRQTIEWSYELLSSAGTAIVRAGGDICGRLHAGGGGGGLRATCSNVDVLNVLGSLLDKSLVYRREGLAGEPRFLMLETIHEYAREKLHSSEEEVELERRHALYIMGLAEQAEPELTRGRQAKWLDRLEAEHENIRAALRWARERIGSLEEQVEAVQVGLRIAGAIWRFWRMRDYLGEASEQLAGLLELDAAVAMQVAALGAQPPARQYRARALYGAAILASQQAHFTVALSQGEEGLALQRELGDKKGIALSLSFLGRLTGSQWDYSAGRSLLEQSLTIRRELEDKEGIAGSLSNLGDLTWWNGDYSAARSLFEESLALGRELEDKEGIAFTLGRLGTMAWQQGDYTTARSRIEESLALTRELEHKSLIALLLCERGLVDYAQGDFIAARSRIEESLALAREFGDKADIASILGYFGQMDYVQGDYATARLYFEESLVLAREFGGREGIASALNNLGLSTYRQGDYATARSLLEQSLALFRQDGDKLGMATALIYMSGLVVASAASMEAEREMVSGEHTREDGVERGARLLGAAEAILASVGAVLDPLNQKVCERDIAAARDQLGDEAFALAREQGQAMTLEQAVAYALDQDDQAALAAAQSTARPVEMPPTDKTTSRSPKLAGKQQDDLTAREAEVLRLLAASLSDGQIADRLVLSKRTVQAHVRAIYSKLDVANRSAATRYAIEQGLL